MTKLISGAVILCLMTPFRVDALEANGWAFGVGAYDTVGNSSFETMLEYRFKPFTIKSVPLTPTVGVAASTDENFWGYVGLHYDYNFVGSWHAIPLLGVGLFEKGDGKDLGGVVVFRSGLELAYELENGHRVSLSFYHLSNASIYELNPGSNSLVVSWSLGR